ncbi:MAG: hypothetical protein J5857_05190 [Treponema sp.]|nr:hypothetical protein [Treponema sp.]
MEKEGVSGIPKKSDSKSGGKIDITISDEDLTDDGEDLRFPVTMNKLGLSQEETKSLKTQQEPVQAKAASSISTASDSSADIPEEKVMDNVSTSIDNGAFKPQSFEPSSPAQEKSPAAPVIDTSTVGLDVNDSSEIDDLPEIADFDAELGDESDDSYVDDSDFASNGSTSLYTERSTFSDGSRASDHDAATIAKAIQTALKREE